MESPYVDPSLADGKYEFYNNMQGLLWDGEPMIHPVTNDTVKIILAGDPFEKTGWYEGEGWPNGYQIR